MEIKLDKKSVDKTFLPSRARELYFELGEVFSDNGVASRNYSKLEELYHLATDSEKLQPEWRKLNAKTIQHLQEENHKLLSCVEFYAVGEIGNDLEIMPDKKELWSIPEEWSQRSMSDYYCGRRARKCIKEINPTP